MKRVRIFWDLDQTLLDTPALLAPILEDLAAAVGSSPGRVREDIRALDAVAFTWERLFARIGLPPARFDEKARMCADRYARAGELLYPGALETVADLDGFSEQVLVTFGDVSFQRAKWAAIPALHPFFAAAHFVDGVAEGKGRVIARYGDAFPTIFADDSDRWLAECERDAPHALRAKMTNPAEDYREIRVLARRLAG